MKIKLNWIVKISMKLPKTRTELSKIRNELSKIRNELSKIKNELSENLIITLELSKLTDDWDYFIYGGQTKEVI